MDDPIRLCAVLPHAQVTTTCWSDPTTEATVCATTTAMHPQLVCVAVDTDDLYVKFLAMDILRRGRTLAPPPPIRSIVRHGP